MNITQSVLENDELNQDIGDPIKYLDLQCLINDQKNTIMVLKILEYEKH